MINLIPPHARKAATTEYWLRVASVAMFMVGAGVVLVIVAHIPTYVLIDLQLDAFSEAAAEARVTDENVKAGEATLAEANELAVLLLEAESEADLVPVITTLNERAGEAITLTGISGSRSRDGLGTFSVSGVATTRESLSAYRDRLEADPLFGEVVLPLSNLARQENISFQFEVQIADVAEG